jgi:hypothetical protein
LKTLKKISILLVLSLVSLQHGCYSFKGIDIPKEAKTVSVQFFSNYTQLAPPTLSPVFTESLRDAFISQTRLALTDKGADLQFEGAITSYSTSPVAIQSNDQAALNRLTISVNVKYYNKFDEKKNFDATFTRFADYPSGQNLSDVEGELIREINRQLIDDIFNRAFINW